MTSAASAAHQYLDRFLDGEVPVPEFEQRIYGSPEMEREIGSDAYLELLAFDYRQVHADFALGRLIEAVYDRTRPGMLLRDRAYRYARALVDGSMPAHQAVHGLANLWSDGYEPVWAGFAGISSELDGLPAPGEEAQLHPDARARQGEWEERWHGLIEQASALARKFLLQAFPDRPPSSSSVDSWKELPMSDGSSPNAAVSTERVLSASPREVFAAFEQPDQLARWWGPKDFTNTFERFEFEPGGRWIFVMHGPNGANFPNESIFREIRPDHRIVIEHVVKPWYRLTVTLTPRGDQTHLAWVQEFESPEVAARMRPLSGTANEQVLDRLQALLAGKGS